VCEVVSIDISENVVWCVCEDVSINSSENSVWCVSEVVSINSSENVMWCVCEVVSINSSEKIVWSVCEVVSINSSENVCFLYKFWCSFQTVVFSVHFAAIVTLTHVRKGTVFVYGLGLFWTCCSDCIYRKRV